MKSNDTTDIDLARDELSSSKMLNFDMGFTSFMGFNHLVFLDIFCFTETVRETDCWVDSAIQCCKPNFTRFRD